MGLKAAHQTEPDSGGAGSPSSEAPEPTGPRRETLMQQIVRRNLPPPGGIPPAAAPEDEQRFVDLQRTDERLAAQVAGLSEQIEQVRDVARDTAQAASLMLGRIAALEARPVPPEQVASDLYRRLTSRPLWTAFILPAAFAVLAAVTGEISWMQAAAIILGGGSVFAGVEGARDIATRRG